MEFEAKIISFATGLLILAGYMILFDLWDYTGFLIAVSSILLLLVAFRDFQFKKIIVINVIFALLLSLFFLKYLGNWIYIPLVAVLILCTVAFNAKLETFLPPLAGVLSLQFINPNFLMKGINAIFLNLAPIFGIRGAIDQLGYLHLYYTRTHLPIFVDEIKILLPFYFAIFVAQVVLLILILMNTNWKTTLKSLPIAVILPFFFSILTLVHLVHNPSTASFIPDSWQTLLFPLTCILLISAWTPGAKIKKMEKIANSSSSNAKKVTCVLLILIAFFSLAIVYYTPIETRSDPVVIIDEYHSEWEPTWTDYIEAYEEDPVSGVNNYYGLLHLLSSLYDVTLIIDRAEKVPAASPVKTVLVDEISLQTLKDIAQGREAVLILKCVTKPYSKAECEAIMQFLAEGNGLILIGEHTNLYDMGTNLDPFAEQLGYRYLPTGIQDVYSESRGTITQRGEFPALIARYLTGGFLWETGCGLEKLDGKGSSSLFEVRSRPSCYAHYENETAPFFLTRVFTEEIKLNCEFQQFLTAAGVKYGEGKAIVWTDSTPFNNGLLGFGEHAQQFIGMIECVDSKEKFNKAFMPFLLLAIALLAIALNRKRPIKVVVVIAILLLLAFNLSYPLAHYTTQFPELKTEPKAIGILMGEDYYDLYFSAVLDVSEVMDENFRQNLTAIMFPEPSEEWFRVCSEVRGLHE